MISVLILYYFKVESNVPLFLILGWTSIPFTWIFRRGCLRFCCQRNGHSDQRKSSNQKSFTFWTPNLLPKNPSRGQNTNSAQTWKYHWSQRHFMWRQNRQTQGNFNKFLVIKTILGENVMKWRWALRLLNTGPFVRSTH